MSRSNMSHVFVGCGGSGAKIAVELCRLMAEDPRWRYEMDQHVFFLLVDTDGGDLEKCASSIRRTAPNIHVSILLTTSGFTAAWEMIDAFKSGIDGLEPDQRRSALQRFSHHWWVRDPYADSLVSAKPFRAPDVIDISSGAGQVPAVSYLAIWQAMRDNSGAVSSVETVINELFDRISQRRAELMVRRGDPLSDFNVMFLGSVAGGTGRGCAIPLAFKLKEMFRQSLGKAPPITGYFMHEDCFAANRESHERLPQVVNSMTGWSELSCWLGHIENEEKDKYSSPAYRFQLPSRTNPHKPSNDVVGAQLLDNDDARQNEYVPFNYVGMISAKTAGGVVVARENIYEMLAASVYMRITQSQIQSKLSNEPRKYFSVGSSVIEIPADSIKKYFTDRARWDSAARLRSSLATDLRDQEVEKLSDMLGFGQGALDDFLSWREGTEARTVMQKFAADLSSVTGVLSERMAGFLAALERQDVADAEHHLESLLDSQDISELVSAVGARLTAVLERALEEIVGQEVSGIAGIVDVIAHALVSDDEKSVLSRHQSAVAVGEVAARLRSQLSSIIDPAGAFSPDVIQAATDRYANLREEFDKARKREGIFSSKRFSPDEISSLRATAQAHLRGLMAKALIKAVSGLPTPSSNSIGLFRSLAARLQTINDNVKVIVDVVREVVADKNINNTSVQEQAEDLFSGEDLFRSIPGIANDDYSFRFRRRVRPPMPDESRLRLRASKLYETIGVILMGPAATGMGVERADHYRQIESAIEACQYEITVKGGDYTEPVMDSFRLSAVLRELADLWPAELTNLYRSDRERYMAVEQAFRNFFGIQLRVIDGKVQLQSEQGKQFADVAKDDFLLLGMATVAARTCRSFWRTRRGQAQVPKLIVQIPVDPGKDSIAAWADTIARNANLQSDSSGSSPVTIIPNHAPVGDSDGAERGFNPYVLLVYCSDGVSSLDEVASLDSWQQDDDVRRALELAEGRDELMVFLGDKMWPDYRGSGFADPCYVTNDQLRLARWRPWARGESDSGDTDRNELLTALAYAWVGPEWFLRQAHKATGNKTLGPMFRYGKMASIEVERRPVLFAEGFNLSVPFKFNYDQASGFQEMPSVGTRLADSLDDLLKTFDPFGAAGIQGTRALSEGVVAEYRSFLEHVGVPARFSPQHNRARFLELIDTLKGYVADRIDGQRTDPEPPSNSNSLIEAELAHAAKFWKAVASALDQLTRRLKG
jgi:hypothetical protein